MRNSEEKDLIVDNVSMEQSQINGRVKNFENFLYKADFGGVPAELVDTSKAESINNKKVRNGYIYLKKIRDIGTEGIESIKAIGVTLYKIIFS